MKFRSMISLACLLFTSSTTFADVITFDFTGEVTSVVENVSGTLPAGIAVGDAVSGTYSFNSEAFDLSSSSVDGSYFIDAMQTDIGSYSFSASSGILWVADNRVFVAGSFEFDMYSVSGSSNGSILSLSLTDQTQSVFSNDSMPLTPPLLSAFSSVNGTLSGPSIDTSNVLSPREYQVLWNIQTLTSSSQVPEPTSLLLLGTGLGVIGVAAGRKRK